MCILILIYFDILIIILFLIYILILFYLLQNTAALFARRSLSVSLWGVVSFKAQGVGLQQLAPLAELTGGAVSVCVCVCE